MYVLVNISTHVITATSSVIPDANYLSQQGLVVYNETELTFPNPMPKDYELPGMLVNNMTVSAAASSMSDGYIHMFTMDAIYKDLTLSINRPFEYVMPDGNIKIFLLTDLFLMNILFYLATSSVDIAKGSLKIYTADNDSVTMDRPYVANMAVYISQALRNANFVQNTIYTQVKANASLQNTTEIYKQPIFASHTQRPTLVNSP